MSAFASLFAQKPAKRATTSVRRFQFESLEDRRVFAADPLMGDGSVAAPVSPGEISIVQELQLASRPGAPVSLVLDFNGHFQKDKVGDKLWLGGWGNVTTPAFNRDGNATTFSVAEQEEIRFIWASVVEDYAPFNINVTTIDPDPQLRNTTAPVLRMVVSGEKDFRGDGATGFAEIGSYGDGARTGYVFLKNGDGSFHSTVSLATAVSHEAAHAFDADHETKPSSSLKNWIMNDSLPRTAHERFVFSNDALGEINSGDNGFTYRIDDHAATFAQATPLRPSSNGMAATGVIERYADKDTFRFETGGGRVTVQVTPPSAGTSFISPVNIGNLDPTIRVTNASGKVLSIDTDRGLNATATLDLPAGVYFVEVGSFGNEGDLGQYMINVQETSGARIVASQFVTLTGGQYGLWVTFNEAINPLTFTSADVRVNGSAAGTGVVSIKQDTVDPKRFLITLAAPANSVAKLDVTVGPNINDLFGNAMDQNNNGVKAEAADAFFATFGGLKSPVKPR